MKSTVSPQLNVQLHLAIGLFFYGLRDQVVPVRAATNVIVRKFSSNYWSEIRTLNYSEQTSFDRCTSDPGRFPGREPPAAYVLARAKRRGSGAGCRGVQRGPRGGPPWEARVTWQPPRPSARQPGPGRPSRPFPRAGKQAGGRGRAHGRKRAARAPTPNLPGPSPLSQPWWQPRGPWPPCLRSCCSPAGSLHPILLSLCHFFIFPPQLRETLIHGAMVKSPPLCYSQSQNCPSIM